MSDDLVIRLIDEAAEYAEWARAKAIYAKAAYLSQKPPPSVPNLPVFGQQWRPWARDRLGYGVETVGGYGCVVTSAACIVSHASGSLITPGMVNLKMIQVGGYKSGTGLFDFRKLEQAFPNTVRYAGQKICIDIPAPVDDIDQWLSQKHYCIVRVDFEPRKAGVTSHYLPLFAGNHKDFYWAVDPWIGSLVMLPPAYSEEANWDAARTIYKVVYYQRV